MKKEKTVAGIDISNGKATIAILSERPEDLRQFSRRYRTIEIEATAEGIATLTSLEFDFAILEPTGLHYSRWVATALEKAGREIRWIDHQILANYRKANSLPNKNDQADAIAMAAYGLEKKHYLSLKLNPLKELYLQLESISGFKNPIINRLRQQLAHELPELAKQRIERDWLQPNPPGLWQVLAGEATRKGQMWANRIDNSIGEGISPFTRGLAQNLCLLERQEYEIEQQIDAIMQSDEFAPYRQVFDRYKITNRTAAILLSQIYPFEEKFLKDGRLNIERFKGTKRNRSLSGFKLLLGMGMVQYQSGSTEKWIPGGSKHCRTALWRWCKITLVIAKETELPEPLIELKAYYSSLNIKGDQKIMRVVSKAVRMIFRDLLKEFRVTSKE